MVTIVNTIAPFAAASGSVTLPADRALAVACGLASGHRPWVFAGPLSLPKVPQEVRSLADIVGWADREMASQDAAAQAERIAEQGEDAPPLEGSNLPSFWRADVSLEENGIRWRPWSRSPDRDRWITIRPGKHGESVIDWSTGTGRESSFIGGVLVAIAGELSLLHGLVHLRSAAA